MPSQRPKATMVSRVRNGRGSIKRAAGVYARITAIGAHGVSRAARAQCSAFSRLANSESGVKRHARASSTSTAAPMASLPHAGFDFLACLAKGRGDVFQGPALGVDAKVRRDQRGRAHEEG